MGFYPRYKIITIFTDIVKVISDFGLRILDSGCLSGDHSLAGRDACPTGF